jgi:hypothetical protein
MTMSMLPTMAGMSAMRQPWQMALVKLRSQKLVAAVRRGRYVTAHTLTVDGGVYSQ